MSSTVSAATTTSASAAATTTDSSGSGTAQTDAGISIVAFFTALSASLIIFGVQMGFFLLLRNKLARIFKPKTFMVPERERSDPPPASPWGLIKTLYKVRDQDIIKKCGLDAYFFLRYLQTLLVIFVPIALIVIPVLVPINYIDGIGQSLSSITNSSDISIPSGLDTIAWGNIKPKHANRRWAHLILAVLVVAWVCYISYSELRIYIKVRQDYLTSAEHRLRASSNTVLVSGIPEKWLTEEALRGLFDVFPGGIRNIWLTRDYTKLLDKIEKRNKIHQKLENVESELIRNAKKCQLKKRKKEEKHERKKQKASKETKAEREERQRDEDARAKRMAQGTGGLSGGDQEIPQIDGMQDGDKSGRDSIDSNDTQNNLKREPSGFKIPVLGTGLKIASQGIKGGAAVFGKAGQGIVGGAKTITHGVDSQLESTGGFQFVNTPTESGISGSSASNGNRGSEAQPGSVVRILENHRSRYGRGHQAQPSDATAEPDTPNQSGVSRPSDVSLINRPNESNVGNTTRKVTDWEALAVTENSKWWQFWKPPSGAYASPIPQGFEGDDFPFDSEKDADGKQKSQWAKMKSQMPFFSSDEDPVDYPSTINPEYPGDEEEDENAEWVKWLKKSDRPTHRLPLFEWTPGWLPGLPLIHKKVDSIYYCRKELARLNMEIEKDQHEHERYPKMNSAFIQFNNQVAAHMACQSVTHHVPKHMAPRVVEVSPGDVLWGNMAIRWWDEWLRTFIVIAIVFGMTILWAFPVAFTSSLSQIDSLVDNYSWLSFIRDNQATYNVAKAVAGVLPALLLAVLLAFVPIIFNFLAQFQGAKTGSQRDETVQVYYFFFLFVQVFLVVSIASGAITTLQDTVTDVQGIPETLAKNLPKAANYFFSYMILQALSTSSGTLLQITVLLVWYVLARIVDDTARSKWKRQTQLPTISWGSFFPVYTNFACIALVYSVIAPLISIFAIITFMLLWMAYRYNMIYVTRFKIDTGGVLYPRAINQTFTGLYFMELCLIGLFFLVRDESGDVACVPQAIIMIVVFALTVVFQYMLNVSFGPLLRYLPITFEDEAVLRDEAFQRLQDRRLGLVDDNGDDEDEVTTLAGGDSRTITGAAGDEVELKKIGKLGTQTSFGLPNRLNPMRGIANAGSWAARGGKKVRNVTIGKAEDSLRNSSAYRQQRRQKDLEAQRAMGEALYGGYNDEIEDLTPEERDALVREAFKHSALRAHRPTVWIPRDDIGVSDDEIRHTINMSDFIWISNEGTALDSKVRVVYGRAPPDFSDLELINL